RVVLASSSTSSACSTAPCQRYTECTPGRIFTQAARFSPTSASAMRWPMARSGQVHRQTSTSLIASLHGAAARAAAGALLRQLFGELEQRHPRLRGRIAERREQPPLLRIV